MERGRVCPIRKVFRLWAGDVHNTPLRVQCEQLYSPVVIFLRPYNFAYVSVRVYKSICFVHTSDKLYLTGRMNTISIFVTLINAKWDRFTNSARVRAREKERWRARALENKPWSALISEILHINWCIDSSLFKFIQNKVCLTLKTEKWPTAIWCWCLKYIMPTRAMTCTWLLPPSGHFEIMQFPRTETHTELFAHYKYILSAHYHLFLDTCTTWSSINWISLWKDN